MAKFPIQYSQTAPGVTQMPTANTGAGEVWRQVAQAGMVVSDLGHKIQDAQDAMRLSVLDRDSDAAFNAATQAMSQTKNKEEADAILAKYEQEISALPAKDRARVSNAYSMRLNQRIEGQMQSLSAAAESAWAKDARDQWQHAYDRSLADGNMPAAYETAALALKTGIIGQEEYNNAVQFAESDSVLAKADVDSYQNPRRAIETLSNESFRAGLDAERLRRAERIAGVANRQFPEVSGEYNKQLTDLMVGGQLNIGEVQARREYISDKDYQAWAKIAMNAPDKPGNVIMAAELKSAASDIWRGALSRNDFDERLREALASPTGINDKQYADVLAEAGRELKASQAEDIRRFSRNAAGAILGEYMGLMSFDAMGNITGVNQLGLSGDEVEVLKQRMHFLSLYEQGLRDFVADNPKVSGRDFYMFAQEQKMRYWNTTLSGIKDVSAAQGRGQGGVQPGEFAPFGTTDTVPTPEALRERNTREAYEEGKLLGYWN